MSIRRKENLPKKKQRFLSENEFETLVRSNISQMLLVANRILKDKSLAEDAVQLAFSKVHERYDTFENRSDIATWVHRIVVNEALMILRQKKRLNEGSIDELLPEFDQSGCRIDTWLAETKSPENKLQDQQSRDVVTTTINKLPTQYRIVLILRDIEEMTTEETANALDISTANVKTRLHRARSALKHLLAPYLERGQL